MPVAMDERAQLKRAIFEHALLLADKPSFDFKNLLTRSALARSAGRQLWALIRPLSPDVLIGPGFGGAPLLYAIAFAALETDGVDLKLWMVRGERKPHRTRRWVEGPECAPEARAVIVDDFLGKGSAIDLVDEALQADTRRVCLVGAAVLLDYQHPEGALRMAVSRFPVLSLFRRHDLGLTRDCTGPLGPAAAQEAPPLIRSTLWWRFDIEGHAERPAKSSPLVADGAVFYADGRSRVWRVAGDSGEVVWRYSALEQPLKGIVQRLQWVDDSLVFGCYDGTATRLDARTGKLLWRWRLDAHVHATPVVDLANQRVFISTEQGGDGEPFGHLFCLDWSTGRVRWRHRLGFWAPGTPVYDAGADLVVATANDQSLVGVGASDGQLRWRAETRGLVRGQPAIFGKQVIVATEDGILQSFDLEQGAPCLERPYGRGSKHQYLSVDGDTVHVFDGSGHLVGLDAWDFRVRWIHRLRSPGVWAPVFWGRYAVVLSENGHLAVVDTASGDKPWEGRIAGDYLQQPAVGRIGEFQVLACASHTAGLQLFSVDSYYTAQRRH